MHSSLVTAHNHTQDFSTVQPLTQSLYAMSYLRPTYSVHTLSSRGHNTQFRLLPTNRYSAAVCKSSAQHDCSFVIYLFYLHRSSSEVPRATATSK